MRKSMTVPALALTAALGFAGAASAQTAVTPVAPTAPAAAGTMAVVAPEGYTLTEFTTVTAEELKGVSVYDAAGNDVATIADIVIGADNKVTGVVTDVGGFLGMGEHRISLNPDQVHVYKNADNHLRAYVMLTKDALKAIPAYQAP